MAEEIGIRELKSQASSIVRRVREEATEYVITHHGHPVAILRPIREEDLLNLQRKESLEVLQQLLDLGGLLVESKLGSESAVELLSTLRDEESQWPS